MTNFDVLDNLDRLLVEALQFSARAPLNSLATALGVSDQTVLRRLRRLRSKAGLSIVGSRSPKQDDEQWIVRLRCAPDAARDLAASLSNRQDTSHVAVVSGGGEVVCSLQPRTPSERNEMLLRRLPRSSRIVSFDASQVLRSFYGGPLSGWTKLNGLSEYQRSTIAGRQTKPAASTSPLHDDDPILALLAKDGRTPLSKLATSVGLSQSTVSRRIASWQSSQQLYFDVDLNSAMLGLPLRVMFWMRVRPSYLAGVANALAVLQPISYVAALSGRTSLVAQGLFADAAALYRFVATDLGSMSVEDVETSIVLKDAAPS